MPRVMALVRRNQTPWCRLRNLCLAGGVGLNCVANEAVSEIRRGSPISSFRPRRHDAGHGDRRRLPPSMPKTQKKAAAGAATRRPYLGPSFNKARDTGCDQGVPDLTARAQQVTGARRRQVDRRRQDRRLVFRGRMEFGPRALGNRSLLADPRPSGDARHPQSERSSTAKISARSHRACSPKHADDWFEVGPRSASHEFMLFTPKVPGRTSSVASRLVVHKDGTRARPAREP